MQAHTSNISKILTVEEEIALAYLLPSYVTQTSKNIRSQETTAQLHQLLNMEMDELTEINRKISENESESEFEEKMKDKYDRESKIFVLTIQLQNSIIEHKNNELKLFLKEINNTIEIKLNVINSRIVEIDAYVESLDKYKVMLETEYKIVMSELDSIHYEEPYIMALDKDNDIHAEFDLNNIFSKLHEYVHPADSTPFIEHAENILQNIINEKMGLNDHKFKNHVKENKAEIFEDLNIKFNFNDKLDAFDRARSLIKEIKKVDDARADAVDEKNNLIQLSDAIKKAHDVIGLHAVSADLNKNAMDVLDSNLISCKDQFSKIDAIVNTPVVMMGVFNDVESFIKSNEFEKTGLIDKSPGVENVDEDDFEKLFNSGYEAEESPVFVNTTAAIYSSIPPDEAKATNHAPEEHHDIPVQAKPETVKPKPAVREEKTAEVTNANNDSGPSFRGGMGR